MPSGVTTPRHTGSLAVPFSSIDTFHPCYPGRAAPCLCLLLQVRWQASPRLDGVALANRLYEATFGFTCVADCTFASPAKLTLSGFLTLNRYRLLAAPCYTVNRQFPWTVLLNGQDEKERGS
jgi:hypothetical protein